MAFPQDPLDVNVELQVGGVWTDVTSDVYLRDPISIKRGRADEGQKTDPGSCSLTFNNRQGKYSPDNPRSPYYGLIGRNTPVRVSLHTGEPYLYLPGGMNDRVSTPDAAALDITGDLDLRLDFTLHEQPPNGFGVMLAAKYGTDGSDHSWYVWLNGRTVKVLWYTSATTWKSVPCPKPISIPASGRVALRITIDTDNGAGKSAVSFYQAETIAGPWTLVASDASLASAPLYASTAPIQLGPPTEGTFPPPAWRSMTGKLHAFELRNGIDGPAVANPDFTAQPAGTTSFADNAGRVWTLEGDSEVTDRRIRFMGEVSSWPARWDVSGQDVWVPVEAAGILRRLGQGKKPLDSTLRRRIPTFSPTAYWPMEEDREATQAYSPIPGVAPLKTTGLEFASDDTLTGSKALPKLGSSASISGTVPAHNATGQWLVGMVYNVAAAPAATTTLLEIRTSGTAQLVRAQLTPTALEVRGYNSDGVQVFLDNPTTGGFAFYGLWNRLELTMSESGGTVTVHVGWADVNGAAVGLNTSFSGTAGRVTGVSSPFGAGLAGARIGHLTVLPSSDTSVFANADNGFTGESADDRATRLSAEEGVQLNRYNGTLATAAMGPQRSNTLLDLLQEAADSDGGVLSEERDLLGLRYRARDTLYNQTPALALDYTADGEVAPPLEPEKDDQQVRNDITVKRVGGSSARAVQEAGPVSVQAPPDGVGQYDESVELSLATDDQPTQIASWRLHLGTWDEARYPKVHVDLAAGPHLIDSVLPMEVGDRITIDNPPPWLPPGTIDLLMEGYAETIGAYDWDLEFNCSPAGPWDVGTVDGGDRADTAGSTLYAAVDPTSTTIPVVSGWFEDFEDNQYAFPISGTWFRTNSEANTLTWSLRSKDIGNGETSDAVIQVPPGARTLTFYYRVSSEANFDFFRILLDGVDVGFTSGEGVWSATSVDVSSVSKVTFRYVKDASNSAGQDCAFVDDVFFSSGPLWVTDATQFPFDIDVGGEVMTVTGISGTANPQTFTVTRSVNGIVKAHAKDTDVRLTSPAYIAL